MRLDPQGGFNSNSVLVPQGRGATRGRGDAGASGLGKKEAGERVFARDQGAQLPGKL